MYIILQVGGDPGTRQRSTPQAPVATPLILKWYDPARYAGFSWPDDGIRRDVIGQTVGRLRSGDLPKPLAAFRTMRLYVCGWSYLGSLIRRRIPLDLAVLRSAYPEGRAGYLAKVRARLDRLVAERWLLKPDADEQDPRIVAWAGPRSARRLPPGGGAGTALR